MSRLVTACETFVLICVCVATASAQAATTSFDQIRFVVTVGQKITVRDTNGGTIKGRVLSVSASSLALNVKGQRRVLTEQEVRRIQARRRDSLKDGAIVGALPPAIIAGAFASEMGKGEALLAGLVWGGMGAGLSAGLDALFHKRELLYENVSASHP
jgi:hypothetical protein